MTTSKFQPAGKHVVITGGASGIGLEVGRCLADRGAASLSIFDISQSALSAASDKLKALSSDTKIHTYQVDVTKYSEVLAAVQSAQQRCGRLDIVFANAGIGPGGKFADKTPEFCEKLISVNYMGVVHTLKAVLPILAMQDSGHIMVTNSLAGYAGVTGLSAYCASKFAVRGLVEALRLEFMGTKVRFHMACPGFTDTSMMQHSRATTSPELGALFDATVPKLLSAPGVARLMIDGLEEGRYITRTPDAAADFLIDGCLTPCSPRPHGLLKDMLLAPFYVLAHHRLTQQLDAASRWYLLQQAPRKSQSSLRAIIWSIALAAVSIVTAMRFLPNL